MIVMILHALATQRGPFKLGRTMQNIEPSPAVSLVAAIVDELRRIQSANATPPRLAYTLEETAAVLGTSKRTIEGEIARGNLRAKMIGRALHVSASELQRYLGAK